jgi:transposase
LHALPRGKRSICRGGFAGERGERCDVVAALSRDGQRGRRPDAGHRPRLLPPHRDWLLSRMADGRDFTLRGLQAELAERGVKVDYRTVWNFVHAEGLSFKTFCQASKSVLTLPASGRGGRSIRDG